MRRLVILIVFLFVGCGSFRPSIVKYSDIYYRPVTRAKLYNPYAGGNGLRSELQWQRNHNRWFNYYFLGLNDFYYNIHFGNDWYFQNQWRFRPYTYTRPIVSPRNRLSPPRVRQVPPRNRGGNTLETPRRRRRNTMTVPRPPVRNNIRVTPNVPRTPNRRTNVQPSRQNSPNNNIGRSNIRKFNRNM